MQREVRLNNLLRFCGIQYWAFVQAELERWTTVIRSAGIKPE